MDRRHYSLEHHVNRIYANNNLATLTVGGSQTIQGSGQIGLADMSLINNGTIDAGSIGSVAIEARQRRQLPDNFHQRLGSQRGGVLALVGGAGTFASSGTIEAATGSKVCSSNLTISGTLSTSGTDRSKIAARATLANVTNAGNFVADNGIITSISGTLTNNGTIAQSSVGSDTDIQVLGAATINGSASLLSRTPVSTTSTPIITSRP